MIDFELICDPASLAARTEEWNALCDRSADSGGPCPFARPDWVLPWLRSYGNGLDLAVVHAWRRSRLVGVLPLCEARPSAIERALVLIENDHTPEGQLALDPLARDEVARSFSLWALGRRTPWTHVELNKLATDAQDYLALSRALRAGRSLVYERRDRATHHTDLRGSWESFVRGQSKNFRKQVRKAERAAEREHLSVELLDRPATITAALDELAAISARSWQGKRGSGTFADRRAAEFYRDMSLAFAARDAAWLFVCRRRAEPIGFILHIVDGTRVDALKSEFDERHGECMVGWQIAARAYAHAAARGAETITMGTWLTEFKRRWTTRSTPYADLNLFTPSLVGGARYLFPHLSKELAKRALGRPSMARCLPLLDFTVTTAPGAGAIRQRPAGQNP